jgi:hypothetical protein
MAVALLLDVHIPRAVLLALRLRGVAVRSAQEEGLATLPDDDLLAWAAVAGRVLVTSDHDFLVLADRWHGEGRGFPGIVFFHPLRVSIGDAVRDLCLIAGAAEASELADRVEFLPL